ncbi:hypothetical protein ABIQ69_03040 [Agromyces sp. G08B096]|uniref:PKD domain-containing protein n=1 Tax=Agromyces sp. G08B096 TaxID=3156399 RepID=A0AAU7WB29_9MICO
MARRQRVLMRSVGALAAASVLVLSPWLAAGASVQEPDFDGFVQGALGAEPDEYGDIQDVVHLVGEYAGGGNEGPGTGPVVVSRPISEAPPPPPPPIPENCSPTDPRDACRVDPTVPAPPPGEPTVTLRDIASFRPTIPLDTMEPDGWAVVGLPANFVSEASVQVVSGSLLGRPAEVRFTPVGYSWSSSGASGVASESPGATWAELGLEEFSPTPTSLVFVERGRYDVQPTVTYVAEYRFNGSVWRAIAGTLDLPAPVRSVLVGEIDSVLVAGDCQARPTGPGC